jgi:acyl-CoA dehydrogenase
MVGFALTEEQEQLRASARDFAQKEIVPVARQHDETGDFPIEVMKKADKAGFMNEAIDPEYGGHGRSAFESVLVAEELGAGCMGIATSIMANSLALAPIMIFGNDAQKEKYLRRFTSEFAVAAFSLTERDAGSDASASKTLAVRDGDDYILNGDKCFSTNAGYADLYVVFAITNPEKGPLGMSAFIVERDMGIEIGTAENKMGQRASNQTDLHLRDVRVPAENLLGKEGRGFKVAMATLDRARASTAAGAVGIGRRAMEEQAVRQAHHQKSSYPVQAGRHGHESRGFPASDLAGRLDGRSGHAPVQAVSLRQVLCG